MKMRPFISIFLALLIFGTRIGYALNVHYCGDRIAEISLAYFPEDCGMESEEEATDPLKTNFSKKTCCEDDTLLFQNHEPQKVHLEVAPKVTILKAIILLPIYNLDLKPVSVSEELYNWNPPPPQLEKLFLVQQSFIFYG